MSRIIVSAGNTAEWQKLVHDGELASETELGEELQSYLVFLLMRYMEKPELMNQIMALEFIRGLRASGQMQQEQLRDVGDSCLLFSGFFPKIADKRRVKVSYYVGIGQSAYHYLADTCQEKMSELFHCVGDAFIHLMDVLQAIRNLDRVHELSLIQAFDLWQDTGSRQALQAIQQTTTAMPMDSGSRHKH